MTKNYKGIINYRVRKFYSIIYILRIDYIILFQEVCELNRLLCKWFNSQNYWNRIMQMIIIEEVNKEFIIEFFAFLCLLFECKRFKSPTYWNRMM